MKNTSTLRKAAALGITAVSAASAFAISPSYPSSSQTDVQASDSVRLYP